MQNLYKKLGILCAAALLIPFRALAWEDGVYRDKAAGYGGDVIVTVKIRNGVIQSLTTENTSGEKSEYYLKAEEALSEAIVSANGLEGVDTVSGATGTSTSILTAMTGILEQASYTGAGTDSARDAKAPVNSVKEPTLTAEPKPTV